MEVGRPWQAPANALRSLREGHVPQGPPVEHSAVEQGLGGDSEAGARGRVALSDADLEPAAQVRVWPLERGVTRGSPTDASFPLWVILMASLTLTRRGQLLFTAADDTFQPPGALLRRLERAFGPGSGHGLFEFGAPGGGAGGSPDFSYWRGRG